jgi:hypothetical protein
MFPHDLLAKGSLVLLIFLLLLPQEQLEARVLVKEVLSWIRNLMIDEQARIMVP